MQIENEDPREVIIPFIVEPPVPEVIEPVTEKEEPSAPNEPLEGNQ